MKQLLLVIIGIFIISNMFPSSKDKVDDKKNQQSTHYQMIKKDNYMSSGVSDYYDNNDYYEDELSPYEYAEENGFSTFEECDDEFGAGTYEEDECNEYIKDNFFYGDESFYGYECTEDCSGHSAGYNWAEENNVTSEYECGGNNNSFIEGCEAYVNENY